MSLYDRGDARLATKITESEADARPRSWIEDAAAKAKGLAGPAGPGRSFCSGGPPTGRD